MRPDIPLLRPQRRGLSRRRARRRQGGAGPAGVRPLRAARPRPGGHAVELPPLPGHALCGARHHGRQRGAAEARLQRAPDRPVHRGRVRARRRPPGRLPDPAHRFGCRRACAARPAHPGGHPHRQFPRRRRGSEGHRRGDQEDGAGAGWQRPLRRPAVRGPTGRGQGRRRRPVPEQRPELHRRQAVHRPRGDRG